MLPIGDDNSDRIRTPYINYALIALNVIVFVWLQQLGSNTAFTLGYATVPAEILTGRDIIIPSGATTLDPITQQPIQVPLQASPHPVYLTLLSSMFMHGGIAHIFGNMLYLMVFGDNLENAMGHLRYLLFYLLTGVLAALAHVASTVFFNGNPYIPALGASGAISAVLAGYMLLFPTRRVRVWFILGFWPIPAFLVVGLWFVFQVINGVGALGAREGSGIAYAAHIGGFIAGLVLVHLFTRREDVALMRERAEAVRRRSQYY
ncbi:rhomboid family intramembrane serine protease [Flaviaesturariibacter amylovorans]|uniref:Rhomboid family intramembrane serine protease n=1 Tax=Flaviaesturariibacter amylovorans TaxID=1084520 RepID=A0ABP8GIN0_9BACT